MNTLKGQLTISRPTSSSGEEWIEISFRDTDATIEFAKFKVDLPSFAKALTGLGYVPGTIEVRGLDIVGMKSENKSELVPNAEHPYGDKKKLAALQAAMKKFEVDGWVGRAGDLENHYNYRPGGVQVAFFRHVKKEKE